ncbi:Adaptor protein-like protein complex AP-2 [Nadsonia fulvescens var. elongata DSM 6958]|uniref:AP-2 complex subunit alpha n=1 Tax=Nadsonia fulvescens var. elongata DSM 6958 TaxID=857566 RepID=A0A1E3PFK8_9ASCO|nr:Adaptor protein-like protein complex AP-2 [Nadsonia fulvescens var. elongata DSM 6958]
MKGLVQFIADLRNTQSRTQESTRINTELANIRSKFRDSSLSGYQKKKYVCKLLYMYTLGYDINFGFVEAIDLINSPKYTEKQIGYLAISTMINENHELVNLVVNSLQKDLDSLNEINNCLALHCIATIGGQEMCLTLNDAIYKLAISPTSSPFVKKKAILTLLRLYRRDLRVIQLNWSDRLAALVDNPDLGVATSAMSLLIALVQNDSTKLDNYNSYRTSYVRVVRRLESLVFQKDYSLDYLYYNVPAPWLLIKIFKLLQYYPLPTEETPLISLRNIIHKVIEDNAIQSKNPQQNNAQNAILFEAINLAIHLDIDRNILQRIVEALGFFITAKMTNMRYLALTSMAMLAARFDNLPIKKHLPTVLQTLRDRDISVRRKSLDLLYALCDVSTVRPIINELIKYLPNTDLVLREELVLKIIILVEKFATESNWYIDVSLKVISLAGSSVNEDIWMRIVQIVVNNEELQLYTAQTLLKTYLLPQRSVVHENLIKIGSYILGEYGHLVANDPGCEPINQLNSLHRAFYLFSPSTQALLLTTYFKFVNLFPELTNTILPIFKQYSHSINNEIQQRSLEYMHIIQTNDLELLRVICDEMPPFPERTSALLGKLHQKEIKAEDKKTWVLGNKMSQKEIELVNTKNETFSGDNKALSTEISNPNSSKNDNNNTASSLLPLQPTLTGAPISSENPSDILSAGWKKWYTPLLVKSNGILYQDSLVTVSIRSEYRKHLGCVILYFENKSTGPINGLSVDLVNPVANKENLMLSTKNYPESQILPGNTTQQVIIIETKGIWSQTPGVKITFTAGATRVLKLKLPVCLGMFADPAPKLSADDFFKRWAQIGAGNREGQQIVKSDQVTQKTLTDSDIVTRLNWTVLDGVDPSPRNLVGASVLHTSQNGNFGCLLRLEPNESYTLYRITVRVTGDFVGSILCKEISECFLSR